MKQVFLRLTMMMLAAVPMTGVGQQVAVLQQQDGLIQTADSVVLDSITGTAHIKFPVSLADIIEGYSNNAVELGRIIKELQMIKADPDLTLHGLTIHGFGSIDGPYVLNEMVARQRTDSLAAFVSTLSDLSDGIITTRSTAEDWETFRQFVEKASDEQIVTAPLKESATTGVGFYINATPNKEHDALQSMWQRNNRYVLHNKVYYRGSGSGAREMTLSGVDFVPVIFDGKDNEEGKEPFEDASGRHEFVGDGCIYDLNNVRKARRYLLLRKKSCMSRRHSSSRMPPITLALG